MAGVVHDDLAGLVKREAEREQLEPLWKHMQAKLGRTRLTVVVAMMSSRVEVLRRKNHSDLDLSAGALGWPEHQLEKCPAGQTVARMLGGVIL